MKKYNRLLEKIAEKYNIHKGHSELEDCYKSRIIYTVCGLMAYASLWDEIDEFEEDISLTHLKNRISKTFFAYKDLYPETALYLPVKSDELEEEICDIFLNSGVVYHSPNRISPAIHTEAKYKKNIFQRGLYLNDINSVSGLGMYSETFEDSNSLKLRQMFRMEEKKLLSTLEVIESSVQWTSNSDFDSTTEYLRITPPFKKGYWINTSDSNTKLSLLRTGMKGSQIYYFYRYSSGSMEVSQIPYWLTDKYNYRSIANAILMKYTTLPPIEYEYDGKIVNIYLNYLLPPRELYFLKLYSWPYSCNTMPSDFRRKCSKEIFESIKGTLHDIGFSFAER